MKTVTTATHPGIFHPDELFALAGLELAGFGLDIVRTRCQDIIDDCDIVVDVGMEYDPDRMRFDHHQDGPDVHGRSAFGLIAHWLWEEDEVPSLIWELVRAVDARDTRVGYNPKSPWDEILGWISDLNDLDIQGIEQSRAFYRSLHFARDILEGIRDYNIHGPKGEIFDRLAEAAAEARETKEEILKARSEKAEIIGVDVDGGRLQAKFAAVDKYVGLNNLTAVHGDDVWGSIFHDHQTNEIKVTVNTDYLKISPESHGAKFVHKNGFFAVWDEAKWNGIIQDLVLEEVKYV